MHLVAQSDAQFPSQVPSQTQKDVRGRVVVALHTVLAGPYSQEQFGIAEMLCVMGCSGRFLKSSRKNGACRLPPLCRIADITPWPPQEQITESHATMIAGAARCARTTRLIHSV